MTVAHIIILLVTGIGAVILAGGIRMLTTRPPQVKEEPRNNPWLWGV